MKRKLILLCAVFLPALSSLLLAQNMTTPPTTESADPNISPPPCANESNTEGCPDGGCGKSDINTIGMPSPCDDGASPINSYNGNAQRKITDLEISGSVGNMPLKFERISNTRLSGRNLLAKASFGKESPWSHNYDWLMRDSGGAPSRPIITITYPDGKERTFWYKTGSTTEWVTTTPLRNSDRIFTSGDDYVLHTFGLDRFHSKRRVHTVTGGVFYRIESITDSESNTYTISYDNDDDTSIRQITDPAGHFIKLHYRDEAIQAANPVKLNTAPIPFDNSNTPPWREIAVTPGDTFRILAFYQGNEADWTSPPRIREIEFYDENDVKINGTPIGSSPWVGANSPDRAFDGNATTYYQYPYRKAGFIGIDLGAGNGKKVSRIRYQFTGSSNANMRFVNINNDLVPTPVISHVEGSDGRIIEYDYAVHTDPGGLFQWVTLAGATYPDTTTAAYNYKTVHEYVTPVIDTMADPRLPSGGKDIRYGYNNNTILGFVTEQFDNASGNLLVSVRWDSNHIPKLVYPNGKVLLHQYKGGNLIRSVDSFGAYTDYTYIDGWITKAVDPLNRTTTYGRRADRRLTSITKPGGSVTSYTRDTEGYIMAVNDNGKTTTYTRDAQRRITRTDHPDGTFEEWTYNSFGQKLTHRLRDATTESWTYSPAGLLLSHTDPAGVVTTYSYNALNRLATETRGDGTPLAQTTGYLYNDRGQITQITHPDGTTTQHVYDDQGNRVGTMDERGILTTRTYDSLGRMLTETTASGTANAQTTTYDYTSSLGGGCGCNTGGLPVTITYPDGTVTLNTYDKEWRLLSTTHAFGTPQAATTSHTYDVVGQKLSTTDPLGRVTTYAYDLDGRLVSETRAYGTADAVTTTRTYGVDGNLLSVTEAAGSPAAVTTAMSYDTMDRMVATTRASGTAIAATTTVAYNTLGQRASTTDPLGRVTTHAYDASGRPQDTILPDGTIFRTVYDALSRPIQSISALGLAEQAVTSTTYDNRDRVITQTDPTGVTTTSAYWPGGLLKSITTGAGRKVDYFYDDNDNRTHVVTAPGTAEQTTAVTVYDSRNRPSTVTDGAGSTTTFTYDPLGRTLTATDQLGHTTTYTYDLVGNLLTTKAADNVVTSTRTYDAHNRLLSDKDGKNQTISYAYEALGRMTSYTDAKGATFAFGYDLLGRLVLRTEPDTTWQSYTYDLAGRLLLHRKADGQTKTHVYGNAQRDFLTSITYSNGEPARVMTYDRLGRMLSAANGSSTVSRAYDPAGRLTGETQALTGGPTGTFVYQYNYATDDGNLTRHTRPDGSHLDYAWNARNLLAGITSDAPPPVATYSYNARNQIASTIIENGLFTATRSYDAAGRLTGLTNGALDSTGYTLSPDGRRTGITRNGDAESYGYDNARQVTSGNYGGLSTTQSWNYDPAGNRQNATTNGVVTNYLANAVNEYTSITGGGHVPPAPTYDANGNATTWNVLPLGSSPDLVGAVFGWNIHNELTSATNASGDTASHAYDALGRRVKRVETIGGITTTTWFFYNGWNVELEHNGTTHTRRHTWGLDLSGDLQGAGGVGGLVMVEHLDTGSGPEPYFPTYDGNGNITAWVDATGTVTARQRYDAFGNILSQTGIAPSDYGFSTKPKGRVTGLYYYGYRYLDPVTGRWINRDPIEEKGGFNLYCFVGNDGIQRWDLLGNMTPYGWGPPNVSPDPPKCCEKEWGGGKFPLNWFHTCKPRDCNEELRGCINRGLVACGALAFRFRGGGHQGGIMGDCLAIYQRACAKQRDYCLEWNKQKGF